MPSHSGGRGRERERERKIEVQGAGGAARQTDLLVQQKRRNYFGRFVRACLARSRALAHIRHTRGRAGEARANDRT